MHFFRYTKMTIRYSKEPFRYSKVELEKNCDSINLKMKEGEKSCQFLMKLVLQLEKEQRE